MADFLKIGGIVIIDRKLLVVRVKTIFINLGGKIEPGESHEECLIREAKEDVWWGVIFLILLACGTCIVWAFFEYVV